MSMIQAVQRKSKMPGSTITLKTLIKHIKGHVGASCLVFILLPCTLSTDHMIFLIIESCELYMY